VAPAQEKRREEPAALPLFSTLCQLRGDEQRMSLAIHKQERFLARLANGLIEVSDVPDLDGTGYQFVQTRGLVVIDSPIGLVACLPTGMAQVSSVVMTAEVGQTLHKGEELGYFQFGGSDFVMVFERASNVQLISQKNVHVNQGTWIGSAYPYTVK
jgi:hypothetical protein